MREITIVLLVAYHRKVRAAERLLEERRFQLQHTLDKMNLTDEELAEYVRRTRGA